MDYTKLIKDIIPLAGGCDNILSATNCMTRLRLKLQQNPSDDKIDAIKQLPGVMGVYPTETEFQIILGPGKAVKAREAMEAELARLKQVQNTQTGLPEQASAESKHIKEKPSIGDGKELRASIKSKNATPFKLLLSKIASIFVPLIPGFIGCGLILALVNGILRYDSSLGELAIVKILAIMGSAILFGLNIFVGVNAAKTFGGTPILGGILAVTIIHPDIASITLSGEQLAPGRGGIIAVLLVCALGAFLEKKIRHIVPEALELFLTPFLTILIAGMASFCILQPLGGIVADVIGMTANIAITSGGAIAGFIMAGLWLPLVMMGIHQGFTPIHAQLLEAYGVNILLPVLAMAGAGQVGAAIAIYLKTKNSHLKKTVASALLPGLMGIGEPLIYGVTLPLGKPFMTACAGAAFGGAVQAYFGVASYTMGISGLPLATVTNNIPMYLLGVVTAYIAGFIITWIVGFEEPE